MNKKLNTIALATSLASLGFCSLTFGWQTNAHPLAATGVAGNSQPSNGVLLPPIIPGEKTVTAGDNTLPPIISGTLIRQATAQTPSGSPVQAQAATGMPTKELTTFDQGAGLKPLTSIMTPDDEPNVARAPNAYRPPTIAKTKPAAPVARVAKAAQGSGTRSVLSSIGQDYASGNFGSQGGSQTRSGGAYDAGPYADAQYAPSNVDGGYADPNLSDPNYFDPGNANGSDFLDPNPSYGNCDTCGNSLVDGACSTCGPAAGYTDGPVIQDYGTFGSVSAANRYLYLDALIMTRADGDIANSNFGTLNDFDFTGGLRATYGTRADSIFGREISFFALPGVDQEISRTDAPGRLSVNTVPNSFAGANPPAFFNATEQTQTKESDLYSLEFNRVNWGWDLVKTFTGFKVVKFDDSYSVTSSGFTGLGAPTSGDFTLDASNTLIGAQVGGELFYDIGYRWSASGFGKYGLFANFNDFDTNFNNDGLNFTSENDGVSLSSVIELGILAHYQIRTNLRFRAGYNAMYIGNVASVADNIGQSTALFVGAETTDSDDVLFHGFNFGLEFYR